MKIEELKRRLPLPELMARLGFEAHTVPLCSSPFRPDNNPSWGIKEENGSWFFHDFATKEGGDELAFIQQALGLGTKDAYHKYRELAGIQGDAIPVLEPLSPGIEWAPARDAFQPAHAKRLSEWRGYSSEFVTWLHENDLVGVVDGLLAFPVSHNPRQPRQNGKVDGAHCFTKEKSWRIMGGKSAPWWIGENDERVYVFESQWDAFAFMDLTKWAEVQAGNSSIVITRGAATGKKLQGLIPGKAEAFLFTQNDPIENDTSPALKWQADIISIHPKCRLIQIPEEHKDFNDWSRAGIDVGTLMLALDSAPLYEDPNAALHPQPMNWDDLLAFKQEDDVNCMLGQRWLSRGHSCVWVGSSGLGKSVLTLQAALTWAAGKPFFGINPKQCYSSLILKQENNFGDVAETVQGVRDGLTEEYPTLDFDAASQKVNIIRLVNKLGLEFIAEVKHQIAEHKPDMLWIDPLLCYLSGDPNSSEDMSAFTNHLDELAMETDTLIHLIHHTGKPKTSRDTKGFTTADISYAGLGSSVLTNWARAIMVLQGERGAEGVFRLTAAKRGKRAQMAQDDLQPPALQIYLKHSDKGLCWLPSEYEPEERSAGRPEKDVPIKLYKETLTEPGKAYPTIAALAKELAKGGELGQRSFERRIENIMKNGDIGENEQGHLIWKG